MAISLEKYNELKRRCDQSKAEHDRAQGAVEQLMIKLKDDFDCTTLDDAKKLRDAKKVKRDQLEALYNEAIKRFNEKWGDKL